MMKKKSNTNTSGVKGALQNIRKEVEHVKRALSTQHRASMEDSVSSSFFHGMVVAKASSSGKVTAKIRMIVATMRIQQYYSSVKEELSPLSENILTRLDRQDHIGFFKSCGPNYIRRAKELSSIFKFTSTSNSVLRLCGV